MFFYVWAPTVSSGMPLIPVGAACAAPTPASPFPHRRRTYKGRWSILVSDYSRLVHILLTQPVDGGMISVDATTISAHAAGIRKVVSGRPGLPALSGAVALAGWIPMPALRTPGLLDNGARMAALPFVSARRFRVRRDPLSSKPCALADLVQDNLVGDEPEERGECAWAPARLGPGRL